VSKKAQRTARPSASRRKRPEIPAPVGLESRLSIALAAQLHRTLLARLEAGADIVVDGSRVEEIDTAILQLLASLWRSGKERGVAIRWSGASRALREQADLIGVTPFLHLPDSASEPGHDPG
jgi:anti-anti-sigma regulatory factor